MSDAVPPEPSDPLIEDHVPEAPEPADGWDIDWIVHNAVVRTGKSYDAVRDMIVTDVPDDVSLQELNYQGLWTPGQLVTLADRYYGVDDV